MKAILDELIKYFNSNANKFDIGFVFLYGSWAEGFPREDSDIDLALKFGRRKINADKEFQIISEISKDLSINLKKEVNIIVIHDEFEKPMLFYNAIIKGVPILIPNISEFARLKFLAIYHMEDFSIFGLKWQKQVAKKNLGG